MARCIFCEEWAGPESDRHEGCARDFERQINQEGLIRHLLAAVMRAPHAIHSGVDGLFGAHPLNRLSPTKK